MSSEWCSAPFTVPKSPPADQSSIDAWRLVVDYRAPNAATVPDAHPLPLIEKEVAARAKGKLFTVLDLRHGFHQMPLRKEDRHLPAMCTPCGTVQWTVLPMDLKNAPWMFQKMMETILFQKHKSLDLQEFCSIYIDDLLIATPLGKNFDECLKLHEEQVRKVLEVLGAAKVGPGRALPRGPGPPAPQGVGGELPPPAGGGVDAAGRMGIHAGRCAPPPGSPAPQPPRAPGTPVCPQALAGDPPGDTARRHPPVGHHPKPSPAHTHPLTTPQASAHRHRRHPQHPRSPAHHTTRRA